MTPEAVFLHLYFTFSAVPLGLSSRHLRCPCLSATQLFWSLFLLEQLHNFFSGAKEKRVRDAGRYRKLHFQYSGEI